MGKTWKAEERKVATALGGHRTPLSGSNSRHSAGDVIESPFFVEVKLSGRTNSVGERYHKLQREDLEELTPLASLEMKALGFLTIRFKNCSDRYVVLPLQEYLVLAPNPLEQEDGDILRHQAQGSKSTRLYRPLLQNLEHTFLASPGEDPFALCLWWGDQSSESQPAAVAITWESLLWLTCLLEICSAGGCTEYTSIHADRDGERDGDGESASGLACPACEAPMEALHGC